MATLRVFCVTSPLWSRRTLICQSTRLLCRWNEPWVPCCPTLFPESVPLRPPGGGVPISPAGCQHAHGKRKSCLLPGAPLRLPLIHKPCRSTHLSSSLSVPCQSLYVRTIQVHQKHVLPVSVAQNLPQSLVKVKAPGGSAPHQPQSGMRPFSEIPRAWLDGRGRCPCIHISEGYTVMDAHHLLPWWDRGLSPTHMAMIYKKWKATLIVLPGVCISLAERLHLGPEIG